jgi:hypothetical protein
MRKLLLFILLLISVTGCAEDSANRTASSSPTLSKQSSENNMVAKSLPKNDDAYVPNPQVTDDRSLIKIGSSFTDEKGEAVLKAYTESGDKIQIGPVELTIKEAKVIGYTPDYSLIDFFHGYTHEEAFDFVKVFVVVKNTSDQSVSFAPVALLKTEKGEQKTWEDDIYLEELNGKLSPGEQKEGNLGFILENPGIKSFTITTSKVFDEDEEELAKEKASNLNFK